MIKINLLPVEKRKPERTPLPRFGLILTNVAVLLVVGFAVIASYIMVLSRDSEVEVLTGDSQRLDKDVATYSGLLAESQGLDSQYQMLRKVTDQRPFEWWRVVDSLWEVVQNNPKVWIDSIEVADGRQIEQKLKQSDPQIAGPFSYGLIVKCHTGGLDVKNLTSFRMDVKRHKVLAHLFPEVNWWTEWAVSEQRDFQEQFSLDFEIVLGNRGAVLPPDGVKP